MTIDFNSKNNCSIFLLRPLTEQAGEWVSENISDDAHFFGAAVVAVGHAPFACRLYKFAGDEPGIGSPGGEAGLVPLLTDFLRRKRFSGSE